MGKNTSSRIILQSVHKPWTMVGNGAFMCQHVLTENYCLQKMLKLKLYKYDTLVW